MDLALIGDFISNNAFPILACLGLAWYTKDSRDKERETLKELNSEHTKEMIAYKGELEKAITNNTSSLDKCTKAIEKLCDRFNNSVL